MARMMQPRRDRKQKPVEKVGGRAIYADRHKDMRTDEQTDRDKTGRQMDLKKDKQTNRQTEIQRDRQRDRHSPVENAMALMNAGE